MSVAVLHGGNTPAPQPSSFLIRAWDRHWRSYTHSLHTQSHTFLSIHIPDTFVHIQTHSNTFRHIQTQSDTFRHRQTHLDTFIHSQTHLYTVRHI